MRDIIITGASRGLGKSLSLGLSNKNTRLFLMARGDLSGTEKGAKAKGAGVRAYSLDIADTEELKNISLKILSDIHKKAPESVFLINNAAILGPAGPSWKNAPEEVEYHFRVNTLAPFILSSLFIRHLLDLPSRKRIVNITSGAAMRPVSGWSSYCSSKVALDMITRCIALEQEGQKHPVKIVSVNPGVMDTKMQEELRNTSKSRIKCSPFIL